MKKKQLTYRELLTKILAILERQSPVIPSTPAQKIYNNQEIKAVLNIKDKYLKKLRDNGYLGYSREGDKYWYTQEDIDSFLQRFHFSDFTSHSELPPP